MKKKSLKGKNNTLDKFIYFSALSYFAFVSRVIPGKQNFSNSPLTNPIKIFGKERMKGPENPGWDGLFLRLFFRYLPIELTSQIILFADYKMTIIYHLKLEENGIEMNLKRSFAKVYTEGKKTPTS